MICKKTMFEAGADSTSVLWLAIRGLAVDRPSVYTYMSLLTQHLSGSVRPVIFGEIRALRHRLPK